MHTCIYRTCSIGSAVLCALCTVQLIAMISNLNCESEYKECSGKSVLACRVSVVPK